jgi:glycosyltransferase involved in cell wall biosynthesis
MKIAVAMRPMDSQGGFRTLTYSWVRALLEQDESVSYLLLYRTPTYVGQFAKYSNAKEVLAPSRSLFLWDQVVMPYHAWKERADVIFHPKFFVPLISHCPVTMGLQEPSWFTRPHEYGKWERRYQKLMIPISIRKSAHVFPNSRFILEESRAVLRMPIEHATLAYSAPEPHFRPVTDRAELDAFQEKYGLPRRFIVVPTRVTHPTHSMLFPGKSPEIAYRAFLRIRDQVSHDLVFAGRRVREYLQQSEGPNANFERVHFIPFVPFEELHLLYNTADVFVNPCVYEGCPNTVLQAMACGRPVIVANAGGSADVAAGAALLAKPLDPDDLAEKLMTVLGNETLRKELGARSLKRIADFTWDRTAAETLKALRQVVEQPQRKHAVGNAHSS